jgi:hypothetical protein
VKFFVEKAGDLLARTADVAAYQLEKAALRCLSKLIVAARLLADNEPSTAVAGVKPFGRGSRLSASAVESNARPHLYERSTLWKLYRSVIFHPHQRRSLVILQNAHRTDVHLVPSLSLADGAPIPRSKDEADDENRREHNSRQDEENFFQALEFCVRPKQFCSPLLWAIDRILSTTPGSFHSHSPRGCVLS